MDLRDQPESLPDDHTPAPSPAPPPPAGDAVEVGAVARQRSDLELLDEHALRQLVATQPVIEQAKGLLMGYYRLDPDQAFEVLSRCSSRSGVKVRDLATRLIEAAATPGPSPLDPSDELTGSHSPVGTPTPGGEVRTRDA